MSAPLVNLATLAKERGTTSTELHRQLTIAGVRTVRLGGRVYVWTEDDAEVGE